MPTNTPSTSSNGTGIRISLANTDDLLILAGISIVSTDSAAVLGNGVGNSATIYGTVYGFASGLNVGNVPSSTSAPSIFIGASGSVGASLESAFSSAIIVWGQAARIANQGSISGYNGINFNGNASLTASSVVNSGTIHATSSAILHFGSANNERLVVTNLASGTITSDLWAFNANGASTQEIIHNSGTIIGDLGFEGGNDVYIGKGNATLTGDILFGNGIDFYEARGSSSVDGRIYGGNDNDRFLPGMGAEIIDGGAGIDTLDFSKGWAVRVALDATFGNTGRAEDDSYIGIENIFGSTFAADMLRGNAVANELYGQGGNDTLSGAGGNDKLSGGAGKDMLTGGAGADQFIFLAPGESGDVITDFAVDDFIAIGVSQFGGGLAARPLAAAKFISHGTNLAGDASDRFIFRTTDKTLWFDADGTGGASAPVLIADLQASATLTAADFLLL